jgi:hypothetical protein
VADCWSARAGVETIFEFTSFALVSGRFFSFAKINFSWPYAQSEDPIQPGISSISTVLPQGFRRRLHSPISSFYPLIIVYSDRIGIPRSSSEHVSDEDEERDGD